MRRHPKRWCCRCRRRIYSALTAQRVDRGLLCIVCQRQSMKEREKLGTGGIVPA